jgi:hypothetical protein
MIKIELNTNKLYQGIVKAMQVWREAAVMYVDKFHKVTGAMKQEHFVTKPELIGTDYIAKIGVSGARLGTRSKRALNFHYPFAVHGDRKAFIITPKKSKVLRFQIGGQWISTKKVMMPARTGDPWFDKTYIASKPKMDKLILDGMELK